MTHPKANFFCGSRAAPPASAGTFEPRLLVTPVLTLWNPYNVTITFTPTSFGLGFTLPNALKYNVNGVQNASHNSIYPANNNIPSLGVAGDALQGELRLHTLRRRR